jgi:hypothetical protein
MRMRAALWLKSIAMQGRRNLGMLQHGLSSWVHLQRAEKGCLVAWSRMAGALMVHHWAGWIARPKNFGRLLLPGPGPSSTPPPPRVKHLHQLHLLEKCTLLMLKNFPGRSRMSSTARIVQFCCLSSVLMALVDLLIVVDEEMYRG